MEIYIGRTSFGKHGNRKEKTREVKTKSKAKPEPKQIFTSTTYRFHWSSVVVNLIVMIFEALEAFSTESEVKSIGKFARSLLVTNLF